MLTVYTHTQREAALSELHRQEAGAEKKGAQVTRFNDANFSREEFEKYFCSTDLFGDVFSIMCDRMLVNTEAKDFFWEKVADIVASMNEFYVFEEKFSADEVKKLTEVGVKVIEDKSKTFKPKDDFNIFALSDALGARDKKRLWVLYQQAIRAGKSAEEINGTLFWSLKSMLAVKNGGGKFLNPYVKSKSISFLKNYPGNEVDTLAFSLVKNYHQSRRGGLPLEEKLEQFILGL